MRIVRLSLWSGRARLWGAGERLIDYSRCHGLRVVAGRASPFGRAAVLAPSARRWRRGRRGSEGGGGAAKNTEKEELLAVLVMVSNPVAGARRAEGGARGRGGEDEGGGGSPRADTADDEAAPREHDSTSRRGRPWRVRPYRRQKVLLHRHKSPPRTPHPAPFVRPRCCYARDLSARADFCARARALGCGGRQPRRRLRGVRRRRRAGPGGSAP